MKKSKPKVVLEGKIVECLPSTDFQVELNNGQTVLTHLAKKTRKYYVQLKPGDRVKVELFATDSTKGKIVRVFESFNPLAVEEVLGSLSSEVEMEIANRPPSTDKP